MTYISYFSTIDRILIVPAEVIMNIKLKDHLQNLLSVKAKIH